VNAATLAKPASKGRTNLKVHDFSFKQRSDRRPNQVGLRSQLNLSYKPRIRHASYFWARNKQNPSLTKTSLNNIAVNRAYFPTPLTEPETSRQLPIAYYDAPAVILPEGVRCTNFAGSCQIPFEDRQRMLAERIAKKRNAGQEIEAADLEVNLCN